MTAKEFFDSQLVTDANSVIKKRAKYYNRFDLIRFAEAYHRNEVKKSAIGVVIRTDCLGCKYNPQKAKKRRCVSCINFNGYEQSVL